MILINLNNKQIKKNALILKKAFQKKVNKIFIQEI